MVVVRMSHERDSYYIMYDGGVFVTYCSPYAIISRMTESPSTIVLHKSQIRLCIENLAKLLQKIEEEK